MKKNIRLTLLLACVSTFSFAQVIISEIHYNPALTGTDAAEEFVEIVNTGLTSVDISGWSVEDNTGGFTFPSVTTLSPGQAIAVARTPATYSGSVGPASFSLLNSGEVLTITDASSAVVNTVTYSSSDGGSNDGNSLNVLDPSLPNSATSSNWAGVFPTPGVFSASLPVTLTAFRAKRTTTGVMLEWTTASEENNDYFSVEMSGDAAYFNESAQIRGSGTTESLQSYTYEYRNLKAGTHYFRLRQVDYDGQSAYSDVVSLTIDGGRDFVMVSNTVRDVLLIDIASPRPAKVLNMAGAVVAEFALTKGRNNLDVSDLPNGMYILSDGRHAKRFVK